MLSISLKLLLLTTEAFNVSLILKVFEVIIINVTFNFFKYCTAIEQYVVYKGRSTTTKLATYQNFLTNPVESGFQVDIIYTDPGCLIVFSIHYCWRSRTNLEQIHILSSILDRAQFVSVGDNISRPISICLTSYNDCCLIK